MRMTKDTNGYIHLSIESQGDVLVMMLLLQAAGLKSAEAISNIKTLDKNCDDEMSQIISGSHDQWSTCLKTSDALYKQLVSLL